MSKMSSKALFEDDEDDDNLNQIGEKYELPINETYAHSYERWRRAEELQKLKDKYGDDPNIESDSSSSDDEYVEPDNPEFDEEFYKALAALKGDKDELKNKEFFATTNVIGCKEQKTKKEKPMTIMDYERKLVVEKGGDLETLLKDADGLSTNTKEFERELEIEKSKMRGDKAGMGFDNDNIGSGDSDDDIFVKSNKPVKVEDDEEPIEVKPKKKKKKKTLNPAAILDNLWGSPSKGLNRDDKFLKDFFVNKRYLEENGDGRSYSDFIVDEESISDDEKTFDHMEMFETKYNHRFEEPDADIIRSHPREIKDSIRVKDDKRKCQREATKLKKEEEKERMRQEIMQLNALKRQEIMDKIEKIKEVSGNNDLGLDDNDLDGEFDPESHDAKMNQMFDQDYYGTATMDDEKPVFPDDDDLYEDYDKYFEHQGGRLDDVEGCAKSVLKEGGYEDPEFNMDADYDPSQAGTSKVSTTSKTKRTRKKQPKFAEVISASKPIFDPDERTFEEYFDEYYKLDFEDIVAGMPVRFNYRKVTPNSFGLSTGEILSSADKELNKWFSLKKMMRYDRTSAQEFRDSQNYAQRSEMVNIKYKFLPSLFAGDPEEIQAAEEERKRKKNEKKKLRKQRKQMMLNGELETDIATNEPEENVDPNDIDISKTFEFSEHEFKFETNDIDDNNSKFNSSKKKKKSKNKDKANVESNEINSNLKSKKAKKSKGSSDSLSITNNLTNNENISTDTQSISNDSGKKSPKTKKRKHGEVDDLLSEDPKEKREKVDEDKNLTKMEGNKITKTRKNLKGDNTKKNVLSEISDARLAAYGINAKKLKRKMIYKDRT